ncbi:LptA/OstA family protein [Desulfocurvus sp. DL9XJH121]
MKPFASLVLCAAVLLTLACVPSLAADGNKVPTKITSDTMIYEQDGRSVTFTGHVHVSRPDMEIWSNKLLVVLKDTGKKTTGSVGADPGEVEKIVATGKVRLLRDGKEGFCGKATYKVEPGVLVMEDSPRLVDAGNTIAGRVIRLYLKDNRSEVEGTRDAQVEAVFFTPADQGKDSGKEGKK